MLLLFALLGLSGVRAEFDIRTIYQLNPFPGQRNQIMVVLRSTNDLSTDTTIRIKGLRNAIGGQTPFGTPMSDGSGVSIPLSCDPRVSTWGKDLRRELAGEVPEYTFGDDVVTRVSPALTYDGMTFSDAGCASGVAGRAVWSQPDFELKFFPSSEWPRETKRTICFELRNPLVGQASPNVVIYSLGASAVAETPMWKNTALQAVTPNVGRLRRCFPGAVGDTLTLNATTTAPLLLNGLERSNLAERLGLNKTVDTSYSFVGPYDTEQFVADPLATSNPASFRYKIVSPDVVTGNVGTLVDIACTGPTSSNPRIGLLTTDGVRAIDITDVGCGCQTPSGNTKVALVASGGGGTGFSGFATIKYYCDGNTSTAAAAGYSNMDTCARACRAPLTIQAYATDARIKDIWACQARVAETKITNPGWGYTSAPMVTFNSSSDIKCTGANLTALMNRGTGFRARVNMIFTCAGSVYSTKAKCTASATACAAAGECVGTLLEAGSIVTADEVVLPGITVENEGSGYVFTSFVLGASNVCSDDVISLHFEDVAGSNGGMDGCTWGDTVNDVDCELCKYILPLANGPNMNKHRHIQSAAVKTIFPASNLTCQYSYDRVFSFTFHRQAVIQAKWSTDQSTTQGECDSVFTTTMAPAPFFGLFFGASSWTQFGDSAPLKVFDKQFLVKRIVQSTAEPGAVNTITVSLAASVDLCEGSRVTLQGLGYSGNIPTGLVPLAYTLEADCLMEPFEAFYNCSEGTGLTGAMVLTVKAGEHVRAGKLVVFTFSVKNDIVDSPILTVGPVKISAFVYCTYNTTWNNTYLLDTYYSNVTNMSLPVEDMDMGAGFAAPFTLKAKAITVKRIYQAFSYPYRAGSTFVGSRQLRVETNQRVRNVFTVELQFNVFLPKTTYIVIDGLTGINDGRTSFDLWADKQVTEQSSAGFGMRGGDTEFLSNAFCNRFAIENSKAICNNNLCTNENPAHTARWLNEEKQMRIYTRKDLPQDRPFIFQFEAISELNADANTPNIRVSTQYEKTSNSREQSFPGGVEFVPVGMDLGWQFACRPKAGFEPVSVFNRVKNPDSIPFLARTPLYIVKKIGQTNPFPNQPNIITVTFATNVPLDATSKVALAPLRGVTFTTNTPLLQNAAGATHTLLSQADFNPNNQELSFNFLQESEPGLEYVFRFTVLTNPDAPQASPAVGIYTTAAASAVVIAPTLMEADLVTDLFPGCTSAGDAAPMLILAKGFCARRGVQLTSQPSQVGNTLNVTFSTTIPLASGTIITISGWDIRARPGPNVSDNGASLFLSTGTNTGFTVGTSPALTFYRVRAGAVVPPGIVYTLTFQTATWQGGPFTKNRDDLKISAEVLGAPGAPTTLLSAVSLEQPAAPSTVCELDTRPNVISEALLCKKQIGQSTAWPGRQNTISVTLNTNVEMTNMWDITISGFRGVTLPLALNIGPIATWENSARKSPSTPTGPDNGKQISNPPGANGQEFGRIVFSPKVNIPAFTDAVMSFNITNPDVEQSASTISVTVNVRTGVSSLSQFSTRVMDNANGTTTDFMSVAGDAAPLKINAPEFLLAQAGQATSYPSADNVITVTLATNYKPTIAWSIVIAGLPSGLSGEFGTGTGLVIATPTCTAQSPINGLDPPADGFEVSPFMDGSKPLNGVGASQGDIVVDGQGSPEIRFRMDLNKYQAGRLYRFSFYVKNLAVTNMNPGQLRVLSRTGDAASEHPVFKDKPTGPKLVTTGTNIDCLLRVNPRVGTAVPALTTTPIFMGMQPIAPAKGDATPFFVRTARVYDSFIVQNSPYPKGPNTITVALFLNVDIDALATDTRVTVTGLRVAQVLDARHPSEASLDSCCFATKAADVASGCNCIEGTDWGQDDLINVTNVDTTSFSFKMPSMSLSSIGADGKFKTESRTLGARFDFAIKVTNFAIKVTNENTPLETNATVSVRLSGYVAVATTRLETLDSFSWMSRPTFFNGVSPRDYFVRNNIYFPTTPVWNIAETRPCWLRTPRFEENFIQQERPYPGVSNWMNILFRTNVPVFKNEKITLKGFGSSTNSSLLIVGSRRDDKEIITTLECWGAQLSATDDASFFKAGVLGDLRTGVAKCEGTRPDRPSDCFNWNMEVTVALVSTEAGRDYRISFQMVNPWRPQPAQSIVIVIDDFISELILKVDDTSCSTCTNVVGDRRVLLIRQPIFNYARVRQTTPWPGADNDVVVEWQTDAPLTVNARVFIKVAPGTGITFDDAQFAMGTNLVRNDSNTPKTIGRLESYDNGIVGVLLDRSPVDRSPVNNGIGCATQTTTNNGITLTWRANCGNISRVDVIKGGSGFTKIGPLSEPNFNFNFGCPTDPIGERYLRSDEIFNLVPDRNRPALNSAPAFNSAIDQYTLTTQPVEPVISETGNTDELRAVTSSCADMKLRFRVTNPVLVAGHPKTPIQIKIEMGYTNVGEAQFQGETVTIGAETGVGTGVYDFQTLEVTKTLVKDKYEMCPQRDNRDPAELCRFDPLVVNDPYNNDAVARQRYYKPVVDDNAPFKVYPPTFVLAETGQKTPFPGEGNQIFFRFAVNYRVREGGVLKINMTGIDTAHLAPITPTPGPSVPTKTPLQSAFVSLDVATTPIIPRGAGMYEAILETQPGSALLYGDYVAVESALVLGSSILAKVITYESFYRRLRVKVEDDTVVPGISNVATYPSRAQNINLPTTISKVVPLSNYTGTSTYMSSDGVDTYSYNNVRARAEFDTLGVFGKWGYFKTDNSGKVWIELTVQPGRTILPGLVYSFQMCARNPVRFQANGNQEGLTTTFDMTPAPTDTTYQLPFSVDANVTTELLDNYNGNYESTSAQMMVDAKPFRVLAQSMVKRYVRQSDAWPARRNRIQAFLSANFPMSIAQGLSFNGFRGAFPYFTDQDLNSLLDTSLLRRNCSVWDFNSSVLCDDGYTVSVNQFYDYNKTLPSSLEVGSTTESWTDQYLQIMVQRALDTTFVISEPTNPQPLSPGIINSQSGVMNFNAQFKAGDFLVLTSSTVPEIVYVLESTGELTPGHFQHKIARGQFGTTARDQTNGTRVFVWLENGIDDDFCNNYAEPPINMTRVIRPGKSIDLSFDVFNPARDKDTNQTQASPLALTPQQPRTLAINGSTLGIALTVATPGLTNPAYSPQINSFTNNAVFHHTSGVNSSSNFKLLYPDGETIPDSAPNEAVGYSVSSDLAPMFVFPYGWIDRALAIHQSNPYPGDRSNVITVTITPSMAILASRDCTDKTTNHVIGATKITISGLANATIGTPTLPNPNPTLSAPPGYDLSTFNPVAAWDTTKKELVVEVVKDMLAGYTYAFQFTVTNPLLPQNAPVVTVSTGGPISQLSWTVKDLATCNWPPATFLRAFSADPTVAKTSFKLQASGAGGKGTGFEAFVDVYNAGSINQVGLRITQGGQGYAPTASDPLVIRFETCPNATLTSPAQRLFCGCPVTTSVASTTPNAAVVGNVNGIKRLRNFPSITCNQPVTNGVLKVKGTDTGEIFGSGFELVFDTVPGVNISPFQPVLAETPATLEDTPYTYESTLNFTQDLANSRRLMRITNFGTGFVHVPFWTGGGPSKSCSCNAWGTPIQTSGDCTTVSSTQFLPTDGDCQCRKYTFEFVTSGNAVCTLNAQDYVMELSGSVIIAPRWFKAAPSLDTDPMKIVPAVVIVKTLGQVAPWPKAKNTMRLRLETNIWLPENSRITIEGFDNATFAYNPTSAAPVPAVGLQSTVCLDLITQNVRIWDTATTAYRSRVVLVLRKDWQPNTQCIVSFRLDNPPAIAPSALVPPATINLRIETATKIELVPQGNVSAGLLDYDQATIGGIERAARPLAIYTDTWPRCFKELDGNGDLRAPFHQLSVKCPCDVDLGDVGATPRLTCETPGGIVPTMKYTKVAQSECQPKTVNTITVTLNSNVPLGATCARPCFSGATITVRGFLGTDPDMYLTPEIFRCLVGRTDSCDVNLKEVRGGAITLGDKTGIFQSTATFTRNDGGATGGTGVAQDLPSGKLILAFEANQVMIPGNDYVFTFQIINGVGNQVSPFIYTEVGGALRLNDGYPGTVIDSITDGLTGPACYQDGNSCKNVRLSLSQEATKSITSPPMSINPLGNFTGLTVSYGAGIPGGASPVEVTFTIGIASLTTIRGDTNQPVHIVVGPNVFNRNPTSTTLTASGDAIRAEWNPNNRTLTLVTRPGVTKAGPQSYTSTVSLLLPKEGIEGCTAGVGAACSWTYQTSPEICNDGIVLPTSRNIQAAGFGSIYDTKIAYISAKANGTSGVGVPGAAADILLSFSIGGAALRPGETVTVSLPGFTGTGSGTGTNFDWSFADEVLTLTANTVVPAGTVTTDYTIPRDANILIPADGISTEQLAAHTIQVNKPGFPGPAPAITDQPVLKFSCQEIPQFRATGTAEGLCDASFKVRMCAVSQASVEAYRDSVGLTGSSGFTGSRASCISAHNSACSAINPRYVGRPGRADESDDVVRATCCQNSPETSTIGVGSVATCETDADCERGILNNIDTAPKVAEIPKICCNYCFLFYGIIACADANGGAPNVTDPAVRNYCINVKNCVPDGPNGNPTGSCFGYADAVNAQVVDTTSGDATITTKGGSGVQIDRGSVGALGIGGTAGVPIIVTELLGATPGTIEPSGSNGNEGKIIRVEQSGFQLAKEVLLTIELDTAFPDKYPDIMGDFGVTRRSLVAEAMRRQDGNTVEEKINDIIANKRWLVVHKLNGTEWKPLGPTGLRRNNSNLVAMAAINSFSTYAAFVRPLPTVPSFQKYITTSGDEVYVTIAIASFLALLLFLIPCLPCCMSEDTKPPLPPPAPPPPIVRQAPAKPKPAPLPVMSPPPPPPEPVLVHEVEPQMRYDTLGAPIKHFGPPIGGDGWTPAPDPEYTVPIRSDPETFGSLGFDSLPVTSYSEVPGMRPMTFSAGANGSPSRGFGVTSPPMTAYNAAFAAPYRGSPTQPPQPIPLFRTAQPYNGNGTYNGTAQPYTNGNGTHNNGSAMPYR